MKNSMTKTLENNTMGIIIGDKIEIKLNNPFWYRGWLLKMLGEVYRRWMEKWVFPNHPELRNIRTITNITNNTTVTINE